jgi:hypothetical protein
MTESGKDSSGFLDRKGFSTRPVSIFEALRDNCVCLARGSFLAATAVRLIDKFLPGRVWNFVETNPQLGFVFGTVVIHETLYVAFNGFLLYHDSMFPHSFLSPYKIERTRSQWPERKLIVKTITQGMIRCGVDLPSWSLYQ